MGLAAGIAAALGVIAIASPASAIDPGDGSWDHSFQSWNGGASLYIEEHGDIIEVCDSAADGYSAHADISWNGGGYSLTAAGAGNCTYSTASTHDIPEGIRVDVTFWSGNTVSVNDIIYFINDH
ncbi:hypothetical protein [Streptomyces sp. Tue6028]|uniref:hypothetical protein n=1 Tax=Streptomyces sp. Tue6028 TaxID=2036037 RepID=UPI003D717E90